jgi:hypothetical protein
MLPLSISSKLKTQNDDDDEEDDDDDGVVSISGGVDGDEDDK